jgi:predicted unusual protein kinase regulating ubiquinone biosynthesis (AarF/ABC1/UbiB family)
MLFLSYLWALSWSRLWPKRYDTKERWIKIHKRNANRMYKGFIRLRGVYIKLGQILSVMGTFLPRYFVEVLEGLQDEVPPQSYRKISRSFKKSFGKLPTEMFTSFAEVPIAAASLGQVHEARNAAGDRIAVKILYPNVATIIKVDLRVLGWALRVYRTFVKIQQIERVHEQLADMLARETNLAHEARCIERMRKNFVGDPDVLFPKIYPELTTVNVLTMSFMDGVKISKKTALAEIGLEPNAVATKLTQVFYKQLFLDKFFHADPHPGNFFVQRGPEGQVRIVVLDLGAASEVRDNLADGMLDILSGMMTRNDNLVVRGIEEMGFVAEGGDRALLERTTRRYFEKLLNFNITDFGKINPDDVANHFADVELKREELRELMKSIAYPEGWFYVERAVVIMFGLSSQLAPTLNTLHVGFPYVMKFIQERQALRNSKVRAAVAPPADAIEKSDKKPDAAVS